MRLATHGKIEIEMIAWRLVVLCCILAAAAPAQEKVNPDAQVLRDFSKRAEDYVQLHNDIRGQVHPLKKAESAAAIVRYQREFARRIREARYGVEQGNIFTPAIAAEFHRLITMTMQGPEAANIRSSLASGTPVRFPDLHADQDYPPGAPLQSTPSSLLLNLPTLPKELEYRVVGRSLVVRDIDANMIVDFISHAIP